MQQETLPFEQGIASAVTEARHREWLRQRLTRIAASGGRARAAANASERDRAAIAASAQTKQRPQRRLGVGSVVQTL
jgi:hypothetical protein